MTLIKNSSTKIWMQEWRLKKLKSIFKETKLIVEAPEAEYSSLQEKKNAVYNVLDPLIDFAQSKKDFDLLNKYRTEIFYIIFN